MAKELCRWLKEDTENVIVNDSGHEQDLTSWYTDFGVENIWVAGAPGEHQPSSVVVELPKDRAKLIRFLLEGLDHTEQHSYDENRDLLHVHFDA